MRTIEEIFALSDNEKKEITKNNLKKVLKYLPKLAYKKPIIIFHFDMEILGCYNGLRKEQLENCRSYGCLMSNSARVFEKEFSDDLYDKTNTFNYKFFGRKFYPYLYHKYGQPNLKWYYLFSMGWSETEFLNFEYAIKRIENLLKNNLECKGYSYETNEIIN